MTSGALFLGVFRLKAEDFGEAWRYKRLKNIDAIMREPQGGVTLKIIRDGVVTDKTLNITTVSPTVNWGHYVFGTFLLGESTGTGVSSQDENLLRTMKKLNLEGRSFMLEFQNVGSGSFTLLEAHMTAKNRSPNYRKSGDVVES